MPAGGIVFTTIQKFAPRARRRDAGALRAARTSIVMADEAHRSQYAQLRREHHGRAAERDPDRVHRHAGREGRPLDAAGVRRLRLGLPDAPGAGGPRDRPDLLRVAPDPARDRRPRAARRRRGGARRTRRTTPRASSSRRGRSWRRSSAPPSGCERLADDIAEHFTARCEVLEGKAMVVAYSRRDRRGADRPAARAPWGGRGRRA